MRRGKGHLRPSGCGNRHARNPRTNTIAGKPITKPCGAFSNHRTASTDNPPMSAHRPAQTAWRGSCGETARSPCARNRDPASPARFRGRKTCTMRIRCRQPCSSLRKAGVSLKIMRIHASRQRFHAPSVTRIENASRCKTGFSRFTHTRGIVAYRARPSPRLPSGQTARQTGTRRA